MVILIRQVCGAADTTEQGHSLLSAIKHELSNSSSVVISFEEVPVATSSFVNASLALLADEIGLDQVKRLVRVTKSTRQINDMIRRCVMPSPRTGAPISSEAWEEVSVK
jgi:hypothetical protein